MKITSKYVIEKVVIKTKSTESRNRLFKLIVDGLKMKKICGWVPGGYPIDRRFKNRDGLNYVGIFCDKITLYYDK